MSYPNGATEWATPQWLFQELSTEFGPFDLDPAATAENAKAPEFFTIGQDGLSQPWHGKVFCNPPYGKVSTPRWLAKARREAASGNAELVVCLVPASTGTIWWREATAAASLVRFLPGRVSFGGGDRAPFASAVIIFGRLTGRHGIVQSICANPGCPRPYRRFWPAPAEPAHLLRRLPEGPVTVTISRLSP